MKVAIHYKDTGFAPRWVKYCQKNNIEYKIVNAYDFDIVDQISDCDVFMWHHHHADYRDALFAKQLLFALESSGKKVFPDFKTGWHFDDKVGEMYLLEAIGAPIVPSYVFYTEKEALHWLNKTTFPKVFKLRGGAGASNVKLVRSEYQAKKLVKKAFRNGIKQFSGFAYLKDRYSKWRHGRDTSLGVIKGFGRLFIPTEYSRMSAREKGYVLFQDFIPNNEYDIRVCVVGSRAFALKRLCREGDFRASGSGNIVYDKEQIDVRCVEMAFDVNKKLGAQSVAFDFVFDNGMPLIVEISYGYAVAAYDKCEGFWTSDMEWHKGSNFDFCGWMVEDLINLL